MTAISDVTVPAGADLWLAVRNDHSTYSPLKAGALTNLAGRKELHRIINFCEPLERSEAIERMNDLNKSSVIFHRLQPALADRAGRLR